jgi:hypothetical protein
VCQIVLKFLREIHYKKSNQREFRENWRGEGRAFITGRSAITFTPVVRNRKERRGKVCVLRQGVRHLQLC